MNLDDLMPLGLFAALVIAFMVVKRLGQISATQARTLLSNGGRLIDVRSPSEFASGHLPNAINVPLQVLPSKVGTLGSKDTPLVLYCASGTRSALARSSLKGLGFTQVYNLGAMSRWQG